MKNTGFESDEFLGDGKLEGIYLGSVVQRDDPDGLCRVRVAIPGLMEKTTWARPRGGGSKNWGKASVPPIGADVYVQFLNMDPRMPIYEPADYGYRNNESEVFPEHEDPDVHVFGIGRFRIVVDQRDAEAGSLRIKLVKNISSVETDVAWIEINDNNSIQVYADSAVGIEAGAIVNVDAPAVQIKNRKVMNTTRPIN